MKRELRNSKLLSLTEVLNDISTHTIIPLLPLFIIQVLGASPFILGLIEGWAQVASTMAHLGSQWFNAQFKEQKRTLLFANALSSVSKAGYAFSSTWPAVLVFRCTDMASSTLSTNSIDALFASKSREFSAASAFRATIGHVGAIIGPFFAALLLIFLINVQTPQEMYHTIFLLAVIPAAVGTLLLLFVKEKKEQLAQLKTAKNLISKDFSQFLLIAAFFSIAQMGLAFFILSASQSISIVLIPIAYLAYTAIYTIFSLPIGILTSALGPKKMLVFAYVLFGAICLGFAFFSGFLAAIALFGALGFSLAIIHSVPKQYLVQTAPGNKYPKAVAAYQGVTGLLLLPANLLAGLLWGITLGPIHLPFIISATIATLAAIALLLFVKDPEQKRTKEQVASS